jgi:hypothetical protein
MAVQLEDSVKVNHKAQDHGPGACQLPSGEAGRATERRGVAWMIGSFLLCPCHLPITLTLLGTLLSGTALGVLIRHHPWLAGGAVAAVWAAGTWRGISYFRRARRQRCVTCATSTTGS